MYPKNGFYPNPGDGNIWTHEPEKSSLVKNRLLLREVVHGTPCVPLDYQNDLISCVLQRSLLCPILFNIYLNNLFFFLQDINISNFADDAASFICDKTLESVLDKL